MTDEAIAPIVKVSMQRDIDVVEYVSVAPPANDENLLDRLAVQVINLNSDPQAYCLICMMMRPELCR